jgi:multisubunit Na+/H+ antiporter MnhC subunit
MTQETTARPARERSFGPTIEFVGRILAPVGVISAVLYYFGYVREQALFSYFGIDLGSLDYSPTDYLVRSAGTLFVPLATLLVAGVVGVAGHHLLMYVLGVASHRWQRIIWITLSVVAVVLLVLGAIGLERRFDPIVSAPAAPIALGAGALLVNYAVETAQTVESVPAPLTEALAATAVVRRVLVVALVLVAIFWATANIAGERGTATARAIELSLADQPQAVVYSRVRLQITGPGVGLQTLAASRAAFAFRYNGLRMLVHTGGRWFLLPVGWTHDNGSTVILLPDTDPNIRIELAP